MGYSRYFAATITRLYQYYTDILSYPKRYPELCKALKVLNIEHEDNESKTILVSELWTISYDSIKDNTRDSSSQKHREELTGATVDVALKVRYQIMKKPILQSERSRERKPTVSFEILEGNPGDVMPDRGKILFITRQDEHRLLGVDVEFAGGMAIQHYLYSKDLDDIDSGEFDVIDYFYQQDVLNLEGKENRLDEMRVHRGSVKL